MNVAATTVRPTGLLNCNVKTYVNTDWPRLERSSVVKALLLVLSSLPIFAFVLSLNGCRA